MNCFRHIDLWYSLWYILYMNHPKKITVQIPESLLRKAQAYTGQGITPTVRQALELISAGSTYEKLLTLRGKVRFSISLKKLREDRE